MTLKDTNFIAIVWDPPIYLGGNGITIQKYKIRILEINYFEEESATVHSHEIESADVMFNKLYDVEVIAVNTCDRESGPANISVIIEAHGELACFSWLILPVLL